MKLALDSQMITLTIEPIEKIGVKHIKINFLLEPVAAFSKKQLGISTKNIKLANI